MPRAKGRGYLSFSLDLCLDRPKLRESANGSSALSTEHRVSRGRDVILSVGDGF